MVNPAQYRLITFLLLIVQPSIIPEQVFACDTVNQQNNPDKLTLLNGRVWRNPYTRVTGDQFFLENIFFTGSVTFNGKRFYNLDLKYDIFNDELILSIESYPVIMLNKEMVDSFSFVSGSRIFRFINAGNDTSEILKGYVNVLYSGPSALYVKYAKMIQPLGDDGINDQFYERHQVYLRKGAEIIPVDGKRNLLNLLIDKKSEIRDYMKKNRIRIQKQDPYTYIRVLEFYDSLTKQQE